MFPTITALTGWKNIPERVIAALADRRQMIDGQAFHLPITIHAAMIKRRFHFVPLCCSEIIDGCLGFLRQIAGNVLHNFLRILPLPLPDFPRNFGAMRFAVRTVDVGIFLLIAREMGPPLRVHLLPVLLRPGAFLREVPGMMFDPKLPRIGIHLRSIGVDIGRMVGGLTRLAARAAGLRIRLSAMEPELRDRLRFPTLRTRFHRHSGDLWRTLITNHDTSLLVRRRVASAPAVWQAPRSAFSGITHYTTKD